MKTKLHVTYQRLLGDQVSPIVAYLRLRDVYEQVILLESSDYHSRENHCSYICFEPLASCVFEDQQVFFSDGKITQSSSCSGDNAFVSALNDFKSQFHIEQPELPFMINGVYGYSCFESVELMEQIDLSKCHSDKLIPLAQYAIYRYILVFDHFKDDLYIIQLSENPEEDTLDHIRHQLFNASVPDYPFSTTSDENSVFDDASFRNMVVKGMEHCQRGDVFQIVLSREFSQNFNGDEFKVYRALRNINPSPYLFFFDYGNFKLMGSSPEAQIIVQEAIAEIHPIAGTFKRTGDVLKDLELAESLKEDPKESAEHVMLVDLARNDLNKHGRQVSVDNYAEIQYFSHVIHMVSKVTAQIQPEAAIDVYADTFPAGTLSGAPKHKAMSLISAYEPVPRTFYGGSIGFIGFDGRINQAIMIRSIMSKGQTLYYQAGAGVVINSNPDSETQEVHNKIAALRSAIQKATEI